MDRKKGVKTAVSLLILSVIVVILFVALINQSQKYLQVSEVVENSDRYMNERVSVIGYVQIGTDDGSGFILAEENKTIDTLTLRVVFDGVRPSGFREGIQVVAEGVLKSDINGYIYLEADNILTKCPSKY